jgi:hypothetical protein
MSIQFDAYIFLWRTVPDEAGFTGEDFHEVLIEFSDGE